jgi:hypothetical protein
MAVAAVAALGWVIATVRNTMLSERLRRTQHGDPVGPEQRTPTTSPVATLDEAASQEDLVLGPRENGARHEASPEEEVAAVLRVHRAETIAELYRRLSRVQRVLASPIGMVQPPQSGPGFLSDAEVAGSRFLDYFDENRILLDDELCVEVDRFAARLRDTWLCFRGAPGSEAAGASSTGLTVGRLAWRSAWHALDEDIPALRQLLEARIRPLLADAEPAHVAASNGSAQAGRQTLGQELSQHRPEALTARRSAEER